MTSRVAARLRKRKERTTDDEETLLSFPANKGFRAFLDGTFERTKTLAVAPGIGCVQCGARSARFCACGASFADDINWEEMTSFVKFIRRPTNPILFMDDASDQSSLRANLGHLCSGLALHAQLRAVARACALGAVSGRPEMINSLKDFWLLEDARRLAAAAQKLAESRGFFSGGQSHGGLAIKGHGVRDAVIKFCTHFESGLIEDLHRWHSSRNPEKRRQFALAATRRFAEISAVFLARVSRRRVAHVFLGSFACSSLGPADVQTSQATPRGLPARPVRDRRDRRVAGGMRRPYSHAPVSPVARRPRGQSSEGGLARLSVRVQENPAPSDAASSSFLFGLSGAVCFRGGPPNIQRLQRQAVVRKTSPPADGEGVLHEAGDGACDCHPA